MKTNSSHSTPSLWETITKHPAKLKEWFLPIALYAAILLGVAVGLIPQIQDIVALREAMSSLSKKRQALETKIQQLTSFTEADLNSKVFLAESSLPSDKPVFQAVDLVQSKAGQYGLVVDGFDFSPGLVASESGAKSQTDLIAPSMELKTTLVGSFESLLQFIDGVERSGPLTDVKGFSVSSSQLDSGVVKTTLTLQIYYLPAPEALPKVTGALQEITDEQLAVLDLMSTYTQTTPTSLAPPAGAPLRDNPFTF